VTLRHEGLPLFLRTSSRLIEWKRTNCKMITLNKISACAGMTPLFSWFVGGQLAMNNLFGDWDLVIQNDSILKKLEGLQNEDCSVQ